MTTPPREVIIDLKYDNVEITADIAPFLQSLRYVDRTLSNKMDELSITLQDVDVLC